MYKAKIRYEVPMLFCMAVYFNFLIGGISGVFLSDVPVNVTVHGGFFVLSHFHYTIMGGLIFAFFAGLYFWLPKMTGRTMNKKLGLWHFWTMFVFFNLTFFPMFIIGLLGQPRRVFTYARDLQTLNDFSSIAAFCLGASFLIFVANLMWSQFIAPQKVPGQSVGLTRSRMADRHTDSALQLRADSGHHDRPVSLQRSRRARARRLGRRSTGARQ